MNIPRTGTDDKPLKFEEANALRAYAISQYPPDEVPEFTCATCVFLAWCEFAYDGYNTNGDCLASK